MHLSMLALLLLGSGDAAQVVNPSRVLDAPKFWAKKVGELDRGQTVTLLKSEGGWCQVSLAGNTVGYVPRSAFQQKTDDLGSMSFSGQAPAASDTQTANASRGFSKDANAADVSKANLGQADKALADYETGTAAAKLDAEMATHMAAFVTQGKLGGGQP